MLVVFFLVPLAEIALALCGGGGGGGGGAIGGCGRCMW